MKTYKPPYSFNGPYVSRDGKLCYIFNVKNKKSQLLEAEAVGEKGLCVTKFIAE
ncbi:MAG TPA: hypothetical protein ACFCUD_07750 [Cyclobacteriaceae bacterium]